MIRGDLYIDVTGQLQALHVVDVPLAALAGKARVFLRFATRSRHPRLRYDARLSKQRGGAFFINQEITTTSVNVFHGYRRSLFCAL